MDEITDFKLTSCRLCANDVLGGLTYIFSSEDDSLGQRLNECLPIMVEKADNLPKQVCEMCLANFEQYQAFFYQVLEAETKLKTRAYETQVIEKEGNECVECPLCVEGSMEVRDGRIILGSKSRNKTSNHVDNDCVVQMMKAEMGLGRDGSVKTEENSLEPDVKFEYICYLCGKGFMAEEEISSHFCDKITESVNKEVGKPKKNVPKTKIQKTGNANDGPKQCDKCGKEYRNLKSLKDHLAFCHPQVLHKCNVCKSTFAKKWLLATHMRKHTGELPYHCQICGKSFASNTHLWNHNNSRHGEKKFQCATCGATGFFNKQDLENHIRTKHTKERALTCNICNKSFMSTNVFYQHRTTHTDVRKFSCTYCNKAFRRIQTLRNHERIHTGERPHACDVCGRAFRQIGDMKKHRLSQHTHYYINKAGNIERVESIGIPSWA